MDTFPLAGARICMIAIDPCRESFTPSRSRNKRLIKKPALVSTVTVRIITGTLLAAQGIGSLVQTLHTYNLLRDNAESNDDLQYVQPLEGRLEHSAFRSRRQPSSEATSGTQPPDLDYLRSREDFFGYHGFLNETGKTGISSPS